MREPTCMTPSINFCFDRPPLLLHFFDMASRRIDLFLSVIPQRQPFGFFLHAIVMITVRKHELESIAVIINPRALLPS